MKLPLRGRLLVAAVAAPIAGCVVFGVSWKEWTIHSLLEKQGAEAVGTVQGSERKSGKSSSSYRLVVSYPVKGTTVQGDFTAKPEVGQAHPVASSIRVVYDPSDVSTARLKSELRSSEFQLLMMLGLGVFALGPICAVFALRLPK